MHYNETSGNSVLKKDLIANYFYVIYQTQIKLAPDLDLNLQSNLMHNCNGAINVLTMRIQFLLVSDISPCLGWL